MRKLTVFTIIVIVVGVTATWGLKAAIYMEVPTPVKEEVIVGPAELEIHLDKSVYKLEEKINITLTLINIGNETIFLSRSSPPVLDFVAYDASHQAIYAYLWGIFPAVVISYPIKPGESFSRTFTWDQQAKIVSYPEAVYQQVEPGTYFIVGRTAPGGGVLYDEAGKAKQIAIETPKVQIEIV